MKNFEKKTYIFIFIGIIALIYNPLVFGNDIDEAIQAYNAKDYNKAISLFSNVAEKEGISASLYYDLANAYAKNGDNGQAMLYYLRSLRLDPSNSQAIDNVKYLESKIYDSNQNELKGKKFSFEPDDPSFFTSLRLYIARDHLSDTWATWAVICFLIFLVCLVLYIFTKNVLARKIGFFGSFISLGITAICIVFSFMAASYVSDEGVIITSKVKLKKEASDTSEEGQINLTKGTRMVILDQNQNEEKKQNWYKVRLNSDFIGWIQDTDFVPVEPLF